MAANPNCIQKQNATLSFDFPLIVLSLLVNLKMLNAITDMNYHVISFKNTIYIMFSIVQQPHKNLTPRD